MAQIETTGVTTVQVGGDVAERLVRVETKLDHLTDIMTKNGAAQEARSNDHENRLRALERKVWYAAGIAMAGGGTAGALVAEILKAGGGG